MFNSTAYHMIGELLEGVPWQVFPESHGNWQTVGKIREGNKLVRLSLLWPDIVVPYLTYNMRL